VKISEVKYDFRSFFGNYNAFCHAAMLKEAYRHFEIGVQQQY